MPEPIVSTILALHRLTTKLVESIQDRKLAAEMREIQKLVITQQTEHFGLQQNCLELGSENSTLKQRVTDLESQIAIANKQRLNNEKEITDSAFAEQNITPKYERYEMQWGCLRFENDGKLYCPACYIRNKAKAPTGRRNTNTRFCSVCKSDIPSG